MTERSRGLSKHTPLRRPHIPLLSQPGLSAGAYRPIPTCEAAEEGLADAAKQEVQVQQPADAQDMERRGSKTRTKLVDMGAEGEASPWHFVEAGWFQLISAVATIGNVVLAVVEADFHHAVPSMFWPEQGLLCFYLLELLFRALYFKGLFLCGPLRLVVWNCLDICIVVSAVADQWVLRPLFGDNAPTASIQVVLRLLRLTRMARVVRIFRILQESDLSWTEGPRFQSFIGSVIAFNALLMGMETDIPWPGWYWIEQGLLIIYVFELTVQLMRYGLRFFSSSNPDIGWNTLDFAIVVSSVADSWVVPGIGLVVQALRGDGHHSGRTKSTMSLGQVMMLMRMLRLMRILRLVKLVKSVKPLFILVTGVLAALQGVIWVLVLTVVTLYAMGIMTTRLIGHKMLFPPGMDVSEEMLAPFLTVPDSMFTLFRVMSGASPDPEAAALDELMKTVPTIKFAFVFFMITSSWTLLSILTAVVSENMISTTNHQETELKLAQFEEDRAEHIRSLKELFRSIDLSGDGLLDQRELANFLTNESNAHETSRLCRAPCRDVLRVINALGVGDQPVGIDQFVENLVDLSSPVTHKSFLLLESQLAHLQRTQEVLLQAMRPNAASPASAAEGAHFHGGTPAESEPPETRRSDAAAEVVAAAAAAPRCEAGGSSGVGEGELECGDAERPHSAARAWRRLDSLPECTGGATPPGVGAAVLHVLHRQELFARSIEAALERLAVHELQVGETMAALQSALSVDRPSGGAGGAGECGRRRLSPWTPGLYHDSESDVPFGGPPWKLNAAPAGGPAQRARMPPSRPRSMPPAVGRCPQRRSPGAGAARCEARPGGGSEVEPL